MCPTQLLCWSTRLILSGKIQSLLCSSELKEQLLSAQLEHKAIRSAACRADGLTVNSHNAPLFSMNNCKHTQTEWCQRGNNWHLIMFWSKIKFLRVKSLSCVQITRREKQVKRINESESALAICNEHKPRKKGFGLHNSTHCIYMYQRLSLLPLNKGGRDVIRVNVALKVLSVEF